MFLTSDDEMSPHTHTSRGPPVTFTCSNSGSWQSKPYRTLESGRKKIVSHNVNDEFFISHNIILWSVSIFVGFELGVSRRRGDNMAGAIVGGLLTNKSVSYFGAPSLKRF